MPMIDRQPAFGLHLLDVLRCLATRLYGPHSSHDGGLCRGIGHSHVATHRQIQEARKLRVLTLFSGGSARWVMGGATGNAGLGNVIGVSVLSAGSDNSGATSCAAASRFVKAGMPNSCCRVAGIDA